MRYSRRKVAIGKAKVLAMLAIAVSVGVHVTSVQADTFRMEEKISDDDSRIGDKNGFNSISWTNKKLTSTYDNEMEMLAKLLYGEAGGVESYEEKAAVVWCVLNRVDSDMFPDTITEVITQECQFDGYDEQNPVRDDLFEIAIDVVGRWRLEKIGVDSGRILPRTYLFFNGDEDGEHNFFHETLFGDSWDWSLESPYK